MADWTKAQLLADIASMYLGVGTPVNPSANGSGPEGAINGVTKYLVNVNEYGASEANRKPTGYRKTITFYVYNEGLGDEKAWYERLEPVNTSNTDVASSVDSYLSYAKIYLSSELRTRILGWILKAIGTVNAEAPGVANHSMRLKWAYDAMHDPTKYVNICMWYISQSEDVRPVGNAAADADLAWLGYMITNIATAYGFTN